MPARNSALPLFVAVLAALPCSHAVAESSTMDQIGQLNEEISVLSLKVKKAELAAQLAKTSATALPQLPSLGALPPPGMPGGAGLTSQMRTDAQVVSIEGLDGRYTATVRHPDGSLEQVMTGDRTADGWTVQQIGQGRVLLGKGKDSKTLLMEPSLQAQGSRTGP